MFGLNLISTKVYQGLILSLSVALLFVFFSLKLAEVELANAKAETERVIADHNLKVAEGEKALRLANDKVAASSLHLAASISTLEAQRNDQVNKIRITSNALLADVQLRAPRSAAVDTAGTPLENSNSTCSSATSGTGASLPREDASFLVGEAARADIHRQALGKCYAEEDLILNALRELNTLPTRE